MQDSPSHQVGQSVPPTKTSRRAIVSWTLKLAGGAALAASVPGTLGVQLAAAQDDEIILTASASEVGARPGGAYANGADARAVADSGSASTEAGGGGAGSGAGPGDSTGAGPGDQTGTGGGGRGGTGGGDQSGSGPGSSTGSGPGDQSGGGGGY